MKRLFSSWAPVPAWFVTCVAVLLLLTVFNIPLWRFVGRYDDVGHIATYGFWVVGGFYFAVISLLALPRVHKTVIVFLLLISAVITPLMIKYGVFIDATMIRNAAETDARETGDLITLSSIAWLFFGAVVPAVILARLPVAYPRLSAKGIAAYLLPVMIGVVVLGAAGFAGMRDIAPFFRNHREVRHVMVPYNAIAATVKYTREQIKAHVAPINFTPSPSEKISWASGDTRRRVIVFMVGETARAQNFGLGGYGRQTTPKLAARGDSIVYFSDFSSCGTSTAVSVPCMFSVLGRSGYSNDAFVQNDTLLQQARNAGFKIYWYDNNSSCKGACKADENVDMTPIKKAHPELCDGGECLDGVLLTGLAQALADNSGQDLFIVLHMMGSHGPLYFKRFPKDLAQYKPYCTNASLNACPREEVVNAYDNSLLYSDQIIDSVMTTLQQHGDDASAMFYVSDHGESLGENGMYLHGAPYMLAPTQQTHVPAVLWLSDAYQAATGITTACMRSNGDDKLSQDHIFASLLDLAGVKSAAPMVTESMLAGCHH